LEGRRTIQKTVFT